MLEVADNEPGWASGLNSFLLICIKICRLICQEQFLTFFDFHLDIIRIKNYILLWLALRRIEC